jgi:hypothetical protein
MRQRKEELAKQKESESLAAAAGPSLSELEKQKMEKMRQFIAQARDAKGIPAGQSALSSLTKPGVLSPLAGLAEGLFKFSVACPLLKAIERDAPTLWWNQCSLLCRRREKAAGTTWCCSSPSFTTPSAIEFGLQIYFL